ncbi:MAG: hypothetical protein H6807_04985 [Planctomycetes bacterium]|nr:hypothetical protein [Planctomycetota bacterium]
MPRPTRDFVECWLDLARRQRPGRLVGMPAARDLVRQRELNLKGAKSRFANELALDAWSGSSGRRPFSYRWLNVRRHLADLAAGRS